MLRTPEFPPLEQVTAPTVEPMHAFSILGIGRSAGYEAITRGQIKAIKIGARYRVPTAWLKRTVQDAA